jgi:DNA modification methylase
MLTVVHGNSLEKLREMASESVQMWATSPPYWGLRDYGVEPSIWGGDPNCEHQWGRSVRLPAQTGGDQSSGLASYNNGLSQERIEAKIQAQSRNAAVSSFCTKCDAWRGALGLEPDPELYVRNMVLIFTEARRVLRKDGTLWLNLGDSYASGGNGSSNTGTCKQFSSRGFAGLRSLGPKTAPHGLKPKDLVGIPWMVAFALRASGWYLRARIPWIKRNCMPESTDDRPSTAIEDVFLLSKSEEYFYDAEAVAMPASPATNARLSQNVEMQIGSARANGGMKRNGNMRAGGTKVAAAGSGIRNNDSFNQAVCMMVSTRNRRNSDWFMESWQGLLSGDDGEPLALIVNTAPYKDAHFATFPTRLVEPMILAGTSARGACSGCGAPWDRIVERGAADLEHQRACGGNSDGEYHGESTKDYGPALAQNASETKARILRGMTERKTVGWRPTCKCAGYRVLATTRRRMHGWSEFRRKWHREQWQRRVDAKFPRTRPCVVGDMFGGSGTSGRAALELGRSAVLIEMNGKYIPMINKRCDVTPALALAL